MSRSGYNDDWDGEGPPPEFYRQAVRRAATGKRGQAFLRELIAALDAMPVKELIADELRDETGAVCAIGSVGVARGMDMSKIDVEDSHAVAKAFGIARALAAEIEWENDDDFCYSKKVTPAQRWQHMRDWAERALAGEIA